MVLVTTRKALEVFREEDGNFRWLPFLVFLGCISGRKPPTSLSINTCADAPLKALPAFGGTVCLFPIKTLTLVN